MGPKHLWCLEEVGQRLKDGRDQVLLLDVDRVEDKRDQIWVLLQHFDSMPGLSEVVDGDDGEALERLVVGLQVRLDDWVQLIVVCGDIAGREVLDHDAEEHHRELFLCQFLRLSVLEHKLEKFRP